MEKRLYRSQKNKMVAGVAGGLAEYFEIDPVIVRIVFIVTALGWGVSIIAYIILWIVVPVKHTVEDLPGNAEAAENEANVNSKTHPDTDTIRASIERRKERRADARMIAAILLILFGSLLMLDKMIPGFEFYYFWPLVLIGIGVYIIYKTKTKKNEYTSGEENEK